MTTVDWLSEGRMIFGAGLGAPLDDEYATFGESADPRVLAARLDEGLAALDLLWSGEQVSFRGKHVVVDDVAFRPVPVRRPRVPVWIGGYWPNKAPMRRAARSPLRPFSAADGRDRVHSCVQIAAQDEQWPMPSSTPDRSGHITQSC